MEAIAGELFKTFIGLGAGGLLAAYMFFQNRTQKEECGREIDAERAERKEAQQQLLKLLEGTIASRVELANGLKVIATKLGA